MTAPLRRRIAKSAVMAVAGSALTLAGAVACGGASVHHGGASPVSTPQAAAPASPLAPVAAYRTAVEVAARDHLRVWIEADMVKRW